MVTVLHIDDRGHLQAIHCGGGSKRAKLATAEKIKAEIDERGQPCIIATNMAQWDAFEREHIS